VNRLPNRNSQLRQHPDRALPLALTISFRVFLGKALYPQISYLRALEIFLFSSGLPCPVSTMFPFWQLDFIKPVMIFGYREPRGRLALV